MTPQCKVYVLDSVEKIIEHLAFISDGWEAFKKPPLNCNIPLNAYFQLVFRVAHGNPDNNLLILLTSKNDKPLGYSIVFNDSQLGLPKSCIWFYYYSNGKCNTVAIESSNFIEAWARKRGYKEIHSQSFRMSGAAIRGFKRVGMKPFSMVFKRNL